jgi:translation initiation factor 2-alpha kinase 4
MAPKKKPAQPSKQNGNDSFPGLKSPGDPASKTRYQELQENEVMVLKAIYGEDFTEHSAAHSAWHVRPRLQRVAAAAAAAAA